MRQAVWPYGRNQPSLVLYVYDEANPHKGRVLFLGRSGGEASRHQSALDAGELFAGGGIKGDGPEITDTHMALPRHPSPEDGEGQGPLLHPYRFVLEVAGRVLAVTQDVFAPEIGRRGEGGLAGYGAGFRDMS